MEEPIHVVTHLTNEWPTSLNPPERVAEMLGISVSRVVELADAGYLPHYRVDGGSPLFRLQEVKTWAANNILSRIEGRALPEALRIVVPAENVVDRPPSPISNIKNLKQIARLSLEPGVYFLCKGQELVYVGQSVVPHARIASHKDKEFDRAYLLPTPESELDDVEGAMIRYLRPPLNGRQSKRRDGAMTAPRGSRPDEQIISEFFIADGIADADGSTLQEQRVASNTE